MKHASATTLATLEHLLTAIRALGVLTEKKPGVFYRKAKAYLHFHEDPEGLFADFKTDGENFTRYRVSTREEQDKFITQVKAVLAP